MKNNTEESVPLLRNSSSAVATKWVPKTSSDGSPTDNATRPRAQSFIETVINYPLDEPLVDKKAEMERVKSRNKLLIASAICVVFMFAEVIGGYLSGSLAILTDAAHMLSDLASFLISLFALYLSGKAPTKQLSFGYHRAEIIGAVMSVLLIWVLTGLLVYQAIYRFINPEPVDGKIMFITAAAGLACNLIMMAALGAHGHGHSHGGGGGHEEGHGHSHSDHGHGHGHGGEDAKNDDGKEEMSINVRAAYIHVIGDLIQSLGVMIASIIVWIKPSWTVVDPLSTFLFSILVLFTTIDIMKEGVHVLMEGVPKGIDQKKIISDLEGITGVINAHDAHIWAITMGKPAIAVHLFIEETTDPNAILVAAQTIICKGHGIYHCTVQMEQENGEVRCKSIRGCCNDMRGS